MDYKIVKRVIDEANLFLKDHSTVREVAKKMKVGKSTVHKDFIEKLPVINEELFNEVFELLNYNKKVRHIRGGEATKKHFLALKNQNDWWS